MKVSTMADFRYERGVHVTDLVTGFKGMIVSRADHITGCNRYCIQPPMDPKKPREVPDPIWIDEHALQVDPHYQQLRLHRSPDQPPG